MNNDRGDVASNSIRCTELPASDPRLTNDMSKPIIIQQQQQQQEAKTLSKPFQITNNPNTSTPDLFSQQACGTINERPELRRLCEMAFLFDQINYWQSAADNRWNLDYFEQVIKAIESASAIPPFNSTNNYIKRLPSITSGLDIDLAADDYYV